MKCRLHPLPLESQVPLGLESTTEMTAMTQTGSYYITVSLNLIFAHLFLQNAEIAVASHYTLRRGLHHLFSGAVGQAWVLWY